MPFCSSQTNILNSHFLEVASIPLKQMELYFLKPFLHMSHEFHLSQSRYFKTGHRYQNIYTAEKLGKQQNSQNCACSVSSRKCLALPNDWRQIEKPNALSGAFISERIFCGYIWMTWRVERNPSTTFWLGVHMMYKHIKVFFKTTN